LNKTHLSKSVFTAFGRRNVQKQASCARRKYPQAGRKRPGGIVRGENVEGNVRQSHLHVESNVLSDGFVKPNQVSTCHNRPHTDVLRRPTRQPRLEKQIRKTLKLRLHDTTGCQTGLTTGLTTYCIV